MKRRGQTSAFVISMVVNISTLAVLHFFFHLSPVTLEQLLAIDSITEPEERKEDEFQKKLDTQVDPATTFNITPGAVSTTVGGRSKTVKAQVKIEPVQDTMLQDAAFTPGETTTLSPHMLGLDLGESEVNGDAQVLVKGYGPALDLLTQELIRMMRTQKLLVVWLFDESESMKDDQLDIKKRMSRVYEELKIVNREPIKAGISRKLRRSVGKKKSLLNEIMVTSVASFGAQYHQLTKSPTSDIAKVLAAIDSVPVDKSGTENMCAALVQAIKKHKVKKSREKRKLVLIVVSDESGDDGLGVETVLRDAKVAKAPIYVLGRESVFGSLYAHVRWIQKETGRLFYLPIRRGPETPFAELMQYDGFRRRRDSHMSGFGPYVQVRLARNTGGIFFQLPHEQQDLNDFDDRKYASYALREYLPNLDSRTKYALERDRSKFRKAIWDVIVLLNPHNKNRKGLELPDPAQSRETFSTNKASFAPRTAKRGQQIKFLVGVIEKAIGYLENVKPLRAKEPSRRWRANYDLILAQLYWYQLRLFEYGLGMDQFVRLDMAASIAKSPPKKRHNRWYIRENGRKLVLPDERNTKLFGIGPEELKEHYHMALARLAEVAKQHPETPWANRAEWETKRPLGVKFHTYYQPPPKPRPPTRPSPKPTPPPKL